MEPKIYIGIPTMTGFAHNKIFMAMWHWGRNYKLTVCFLEGAAPVDSARNILVKRFLETDCTHLLFIDDDIVPPKHALGQMLEADKDVVSPVCFMPSKEGENGIIKPASFVRSDSVCGFDYRYSNKLEKVDVVTGGCFLIKREVFEKIKRPFSFDYDEDGILVRTEEFTFAAKVRAAGFQLYTDYTLVCRHKRLFDLAEINEYLNKVRNSLEKGEEECNLKLL